VDVRWTPTDPGIHVSGHACRDEQRRMIEIAEPRAFVPIHGAFHQLAAHARLARDLGVREVAILEDGQSGVFDGRAVTRGDDFSCPRVHAWEGHEVAEGVIGERRALAKDGVAFVTVDLDRDGRAAGDAEVATRGVVPEYMHPALTTAVRREIASAAADMPPPHTREAVSEVVRRAARRAAHDLTGRKPVTTVLLRAPR
jgi:ribonuclease J